MLEGLSVLNRMVSTNLFPEIAYNLLTNRRYGVGEFIGNNAISDKSLSKSLLSTAMPMIFTGTA